MSQSITDRRTGLELVAVAISAVTLLATLGGWIWFGGRLAQRVDSLEATAAAVQLQVSSLRDRNAGQDSDIAVTKAQYSEIITRLNRIDSKLDRVR